MPRSVRFVLPLLCSLALVAAALPARAQSPSAGIRIGSADVRLSGRVQTQLNTTTVDGEPDVQWLMRRARFELRVQANDLVGGKVQPDFGGDRFTLKDAYVDFAFAPAARLLVGQAHRPFGLLTRYSSLRMPPIEKGAEIRGIQAWDQVNLVKNLGYSNRDIGVQLLGAPAGAPLGLEYEVALLQGPVAAEVRDGGTLQVVARLAATPRDRVTVGASWSRRDFASAGPGAAGERLRDGHAFALDLAVEPASSGLLLLAEVTSGDFDPWLGATFRGAQLWVAYDVVPTGGRVSMIEPLLRVSHGALAGAAGLQGGTLVTPGLNLYLGGLNRVMLNYDLWLPAAAAADEGSLKAMVQLSF